MIGSFLGFFLLCVVVGRLYGLYVVGREYVLLLFVLYFLSLAYWTAGFVKSKFPNSSTS